MLHINMCRNGYNYMFLYPGIQSYSITTSVTAIHGWMVGCEFSRTVSFFLSLVG